MVSFHRRRKQTGANPLAALEHSLARDGAAVNAQHRASRQAGQEPLWTDRRFKNAAQRQFMYSVTLLDVQYVSGRKR